MPDSSAASDSPAASSALARSYAPAAVQALVDLLSSSDVEARVMAATTLLNLGYGQPVQPLAFDTTGVHVEVHTDEPPGQRANGEDVEDGAAWRAWVRQRGD